MPLVALRGRSPYVVRGDVRDVRGRATSKGEDVQFVARLGQAAAQARRPIAHVGISDQHDRPRRRDVPFDARNGVAQLTRMSVDVTGAHGSFAGILSE